MSGRNGSPAIRVGIVVLLLGLGTAGGRAQEGPPSPAGALIVPGKPPDLTVLATGDVLGFVDPCG